MAVLEVTSRQFRDRQKTFFDLADTGRQIIIRRGKKQAYALAPINDDDLYFTPEMEAKIERALQQYKEGKHTVISTEEGINHFFDSL